MESRVKHIALWDTMFHTVCCGHMAHILENVKRSSMHTENLHSVQSVNTAYCNNSTSTAVVCYSEHTPGFWAPSFDKPQSESCQHTGNPSSVVFTPLVRKTHMLRNGCDFCVQGHIQSSQMVFESQLHTPYRPNMLLLIDWTSHTVRRPQHGGNTSLSAGYQLVEGAAGSA